MSAAQPILRRVAGDSDYVKKRVELLDSWAISGKVEPWIAVLLAEMIRKGAGKGEDTKDADFDRVFLSDEMIEIMREQVDGPWMIYVEQANAERSNNMVMGFLSELEDAMGSI